MRKKRIKESEKILNANKPFLITVCVIFGIYCLTLIFPFIWLMLNSVKTPNEFLENSMSLPKHFLISNYVTMFVEFDLPSMFMNTLLMCLVIPTIEIILTCGVAYALAKFKFKLRPVLYFLIILNIYVSLSGTLPVTYKLLNDLGILDTFWALMIMGANGLNFHTLIFLGIFQNLSNEYREAAEIDGAGYWTVYLRIYFPMIFTTALSLWLLSFIGQWNNYTAPYLFWNSHQTLATGIDYLSKNMGSGQYANEYPKLYAAMVITIIPVIVIFACFQRPISKMSVGGGLKG